MKLKRIQPEIISLDGKLIEVENGKVMTLGLSGTEITCVKRFLNKQSTLEMDACIAEVAAMYQLSVYQIKSKRVGLDK